MPWSAGCATTWPAALAYAEASPYPDAAEMLTDVYAAWVTRRPP